MLWTMKGEECKNEKYRDRDFLYEIDKTEFAELHKGLWCCKNRIAPQTDNINMELQKYLPELNSGS